jgi:DNA-binding NarL/FixJ family response regulator
VTIRLLVADDQELVRAGFAAVLNTQPDFEVVGEAADGREAVDGARRHHPDVVLMDIRMPNLDGIAATAEICADPRVTTRVLILTTFDLDEYVMAALRAGASGFLLKDAPRDSLYGAVRTVASGDALLAPSVTRRLIEQQLRTTEPPPGLRRRLHSMTDREREVLTLLARGLSNTDIADHLHLGEPTVRTHVGRIYGKAGARDRAQAVVFAYESGLVRAGHTGGRRPA